MLYKNGEGVRLGGFFVFFWGAHNLRGGAGGRGGGGGEGRSLLTSYFYTEIHLGAIYSSENVQAGCIVGYCIYPRPAQDRAECHSHSTPPNQLDKLILYVSR